MTQIVDFSRVDAFPTNLRAAAFRTAKLSEFRTATPSVLFGQKLKDVETLEMSISQYGLMRPLKVTEAANKLVVLDGRKRLAALRRMRFKNTLPRSLVNVPFVLSTEPVPHMLSAQEQYQNMKRFIEKGVHQAKIAEVLCLNSKQLSMLQSIDRLSPKLKSAFLTEAISLEQAWAFAALPRHDAQDSLLLSLGPFVGPEGIMKAIAEAQDKPALQSTYNAAFQTDVIAFASPPIAGLTSQSFSGQTQNAA